MYWEYTDDEGVNGPSTTGYDGPARRVGPSQIGARELSWRVELCDRPTTPKGVGYFAGSP